jgi:Tol biopolymer transport system component
LLFSLSCDRRAATEADLIAAWRAAGLPGNLRITYPRSGAVFPLEMASATFQWTDDSGAADTWLVHFGVREGPPILTKRIVQSNPAWSPDGKYLLFARSKAYHSKMAEASKSAVLPREAGAEFLRGEKIFQYDIYKVPFNGGAGGEAFPLEGASANGMSNYFPKVTPDGKWVVFVKAKSFMLLQPDSRLFIVPAAGGEAREMRCNNASMNSWHSFSPNGRWMVFSSKQRGAYTQLWLTHLDEDGNDAPAVLLEHLVSRDHAANIPEFLSLEGDAPVRLVDQFSQGGNYHYRIAKNLLRYGELDGALKALNRAVRKAPDNPEVFLERGALSYRMKQ